MDASIWIDLFKKLSSGDVVELKEMIKEMLRKCGEAQAYEDLSEEVLLEIIYIYIYIYRYRGIFEFDCV